MDALWTSLLVLCDIITDSILAWPLHRCTYQRGADVHPGIMHLLVVHPGPDARTMLAHRPSDDRLAWQGQQL